MATKATLSMARILTISVLASGTGMVGSGVHNVNFQVDPDDYDTNFDGFITGNEFQPEGSFGGNPDGVFFSMIPTDNLVGGSRFLLSETNGLHFGGGGGS
ncbi:MAG: hypothetical protein K8E66_03370, partial [Phycisphaerales bacterium]|nr:hypothetical protein [Phycisphaerales bacterium]